MRILTAAQMRQADQRTQDNIGIPSNVLMENAGREVVASIESAFGCLENSRIAVLCGRGSNGGDGFVVARILRQHGVEVDVYLLGVVSDVRGDARANLFALDSICVPVIEISAIEQWKLYALEIIGHDLLVDAVFGIGLNKPLAGILQTAVSEINKADLPVVSIDLPTGLSADTNAVVGEAIKADLTVALGAPKIPLIFPPACSQAGDLVVADIGIPRKVIDDLDGARLCLLTPAGIRESIPTRPPDAHKGNFGHVLIVAGSLGKSGAACLAGVGALRSGAGLVTIATPRSCLETVSAWASEYMTIPLPETTDGFVEGEALNTILKFRCDVIAVGPGLGVGEGVTTVVNGLVEQAKVPLVVDADALNVLDGGGRKLNNLKGSDLIITPHPGEMARLLQIGTDQVQASRVETACKFAINSGAHVILKGHRTIIALPDGCAYVNQTGNPGMATGGTGDVLTGMVAAWLAQLFDAATACKVAVHLHGLAGDLAVKKHGEIAMTASDLVGELGNAMRNTCGLDSTTEMSQAL
jgi:hydroxyethylthiazole kinase-like uncharacterized protein yjeF